MRGHNIVRAIKEEFEQEVIYNIEENDTEVLFRFKAKDMDILEKYLKPKTGGSNISPFSSKNLPKNRSYKISDEEMVSYKSIIRNIGKKQIIKLSYMTNNYLKSLVTKRNTWEDIKADMALKGLTGKNYIHSINKWDEYIDFLRKELSLS